MAFENIPNEMKQHPRWILWKLEDRGGKKPTKTPYSVKGGFAKVNDPSTWSTFEEAIQAYERGEYNGIGFVFTDTPFVGIDIDGCFNLEKGEISKEAADLLLIAENTYMEFSKSGTGFHVILKGKLPDGRRRNGTFEMYGDGSPRYFAMTGDQCSKCGEIREDQAAIDTIHSKYIASHETPERVSPRRPEPFSLSEDQIIERAKVEKPTEWDEPIPFDAIETPDFPTDCLPPPLAAFVNALAESTQTPPEMAAVLSLGVMATAFQSKFEVEITPDWKEPLCLYVVANAPPGEKKSSVIGKLIEPVYAYEAERREAEAVEIRQNQDERSMLEQRLEAAKKTAAKAKGENALIARQEALDISAELAEFKDMHPYRLLVDDTTPEKLVDIMDIQGGCITVSSAEGGLFDSMSGRYDKSSNFDIYLKGHAGDPITVDRIGRKSNHAKSPRLTMMLTIQPDVVNGLMNNATLRGRGLCGRFLYAKCRSKVGFRNVNPSPIPYEVKNQYNLFIKDILSSQYKGTIRLSNHAQKLRIQYAETIEHRLGDSMEYMRDWGGKAVGAMLRIAALIHASEVQVNPADVNISEETITAAINIYAMLDMAVLRPEHIAYISGLK